MFKVYLQGKCQSCSGEKVPKGPLEVILLVCGVDSVECYVG